MTPLGFAFLAAGANLAGAAVVIRHMRAGIRAVDFSIAFGAGFMMAVALLGVVPEVVAHGSGAAVYMLGGYLAVHLTQHVLAPHFHFGEETHAISASVSMSALLGITLHTFFDGVAIASGFLASPQLGVLLFLAVFLHKLPEGVTVASLMLAGGRGRRAASAAAVGIGLATILGVLLTEYVAPLAAHGLAISAGVTLYVAASNLVPEFQAKRGWGVTVAFFGGVGTFLLTERLLERFGAG